METKATASKFGSPPDRSSRECVGSIIVYDLVTELDDFWYTVV